MAIISTEEMERLLVIRLSALGDVVLTTPFIRMLHSKFPKARIDYVVKKRLAPLVRNNPHIDAVHELRSGDRPFWSLVKTIRKMEYSAVFDLQQSTRSRIMAACSGARIKAGYNTRRLNRFMLVRFKKNIYKNSVPVPLRFLEALEPFGYEDDGRGCELFVADSARVQAKKLLNKKTGDKGFGKFVALAPGAGRRTKQWHAQGFAETGKYFLSKGYSIILLGGTDDTSVCADVLDRIGHGAFSLCGMTSIMETAAVLSMSRLLVANDTGVMHMAGSVNTPVVAVFGPTSAELGFFPFRSVFRVVEIPLDCRPCSFHGTDTCPRGHFNCMNQISSGMVIHASEQLLESGSI